MAYIVYKANKFDLNENFSIGRDKSNDLVIAEGTVSRHHAVFRIVGDKYYIIDMGSSNGTYANGKSVQTPTLLKDKTIIQCGNAQIVFYEDKDDEDSDETILAFSSNFVVDSTVLVIDIKNYTTFSENTPIQMVSKVMAKWLKEVNLIIEKYNGLIDSFIGDCVYARWDEKTDRQTIINVLKVSKYINDKTKEITSTITNGKTILSVGVGINIGEVIVGAETNNTGLGDTVNTTFRLESQTRTLKTDVIISKEVYEVLNLDKKLVDTILKGKKNIIQVCPLTFDEIDSIN